MKAAAVLLAAVTAGPAAACEVALALAIDVSKSVDATEYRLQMGGLAAALADPEVTAALVAMEAAVMVYEWSGDARHVVVVPWTRVTQPGVAATVAAQVAGAERSWAEFSTGLGSALVFGAGGFSRVADCARQVIDVSGDGRSNAGMPLEPVRAGLVAQDITINGLAIEGSERGLTEYYRDAVIGGPGAFVVTARSFADYPEAIRLKLLHELTQPVSALPPGDQRRAEAEPQQERTAR